MGDTLVEEADGPKAYNWAQPMAKLADRVLQYLCRQPLSLQQQRSSSSQRIFTTPFAVSGISCGSAAFFACGVVCSLCAFAATFSLLHARNV
jgi:hypothetical protein